MPTPAESQLMNVLLEDLGEQFDVEVLDVESNDLGLTAQLRIHSRGSAEDQASAPAPVRHLRVVRADNFD